MKQLQIFLQVRLKALLPTLASISFISLFCCNVVASDFAIEAEANQANSRILALTETMRNRIFETALIKKEATCNSVSNSSFQRLDEQLIGYWTVVCGGQARYSIQILNNARGSMTAKACGLVVGTKVPCKDANGKDENIKQRLAIAEQVKEFEQEKMPYRSKLKTVGVGAETVLKMEESAIEELWAENQNESFDKNTNESSDAGIPWLPF